MNDRIKMQEDVYPTFEDPEKMIPVRTAKKYYLSVVNESNNAKERVLLLVEENGDVKIVPDAEQPEDQFPQFRKGI